MHKYKPISFVEWQKQQADLPIEICSCCKGSGQVPCECYCGDEHTKTCEKCDGDLTEIGGLLEYQKQIEADRKKWNEYHQAVLGVQVDERPDQRLTH